MPKVKIIYTQTYSGDYYDDEIVKKGTEWEEVSDEEFEILRKHIHRFPYYKNMYPRLIIQSDETVKESLATVREWMETEKVRLAKEAEKRAKAKADREKQKLQQKRKQLEELKKELGEA